MRTSQAPIRVAAWTATAAVGNPYFDVGFRAHRSRSRRTGGRLALLVVLGVRELDRLGVGPAHGDRLVLLAVHLVPRRDRVGPGRELGEREAAVGAGDSEEGMVHHAGV